ncbi:MAG: hypothetical protein AB8E74_10460 [Prochlorococcus sp.]
MARIPVISWLIDEDRSAYYWLKKKTGSTEYQAAWWVWLFGVICGIVIMLIFG